VQLADEAIGDGVLETHFAQLRDSAVADLTGGESSDAVMLRRSADVRFRGQSHELEVPVGNGLIDDAILERLRDDFVGRHRTAFGVGAPGPLEIVNIRLRATLPVERIAFARPAMKDVPRFDEWRSAWDPVDGVFTTTPVLALSDVPLDTEGSTVAALAGPALVETPESTILVPRGWQAMRGSSGAVVLRRLLATASEGKRP
jgi:N-methylhydantoinase A